MSTPSHRLRRLCWRAGAVARVAAVLVVCAIPPAFGQIEVLTQHNDNGRTGENRSEPLLTTSNVAPSTFGKLFSIPIDGLTFAQPLYVGGLTIGGSFHNALFLATTNDSVYACDADTGAVLWQRSLGTPVPSATVRAPSLLTNVGITSTPVIDAGSQTLYVVAKTFEQQNQIYRLHALDLTTGSDRPNSPVVLSASASGSGAGSRGGTIPFVASQENQRPALTFANGKVYIAFASYEDAVPYHGWILAYDGTTLAQTGVYNDTPNGDMGGIWMSGQGLDADSSGSVYAITGNSQQSFEHRQGDAGESFIKLDGTTLTQTDFFKASNYDVLNVNDTDLGSGGAMLIPGTTELVGGGKQGLMYVVDTLDMGGLGAGVDNVVQEWQADNGLWGNPAFCSSQTQPTMYVWSSSDVLKAYAYLENGQFNSTPSSQSAASIGDGDGSGCLSVSRNGDTAGTAIVWATAPTGQPDEVLIPGTLYAFDASDVSHELWDSGQNAARDAYGNYAKWVAPTVANGKVYVATDSNQVVVYGLLSAPGTPSISNLVPNSAPLGSAAFTLTVFGAGFTPASVVNWNAQPLPTTFVSGGQLTAAVPASDLTPALPASVEIVDTAEGTSPWVPFDVNTPHMYPAGLQMVSVPMDYTGVFNPVFGLTTFTLAAWDPIADAYAIAPAPPADAVRQGRGYWVRFSGSADIFSAGNDLGLGQSSFDIALSAGWNIIGDPSSSPVPLSGLQIVANGQPTPFTSSPLVSLPLYTYDSSTNAYTAETSNLNPWLGYWLKANQACTLRVPLP